MIVTSLFPTPVSKFELGREFTTEENKFVSEITYRKNVGNSLTNDMYVLNHESMNEIKKFVQACVNRHFNHIYAPKDEVKLRITQSWMNITKPGEWHHKHEHPNSFVSGVLYMKAARERDKIYFYNEEYEQFQFATENFNPYNSRTWWLPVGTGDLMLFPSSLTHGVNTVELDDRISLAFNTFPVGYLGQELGATALHLRD